eukprot:803232-Alexandrium_andersonii.AAC.1
MIKQWRIQEQRERQQMMIYDKATEIQRTVANDRHLPKYLRTLYSELQSGSIDMARGRAANAA